MRAAIAAVAGDLQRRGEEAGGSARDMLEAQAMIAEDPTLQDEVDARIDDGATAEWAVHDAFAGFRATLEAVGGYLGERAADLDDISQRVLAQLRGLPAPGAPDPGHPFVLVARDLAPADTALLNLEKVLALVTFEGGLTSHTAILAREKGIVAVVGAAEARDLATGTPVIVDAASGTVVADPGQEEQERAAQRIADWRSAEADHPAGQPRKAGGRGRGRRARRRGRRALPHRVPLPVLETQAPTVSQQREAYRELLAAFPGKKVVVRVLDAGAD